LALRTVVVLRDIYGLSHDEIATELGISGAATRVRLHRARRQLRAAIFPELSSDGAERVDGDAEVATVIAVRHMEPVGDDARAL
jgi:predicted RNA polymerase sigma factor